MEGWTTSLNSQKQMKTEPSHPGTKDTTRDITRKKTLSSFQFICIFPSTFQSVHQHSLTADTLSDWTKTKQEKKTTVFCQKKEVACPRVTWPDHMTSASQHANHEENQRNEMNHAAPANERVVIDWCSDRRSGDDEEGSSEHQSSPKTTIRRIQTLRLK